MTSPSTSHHRLPQLLVDAHVHLHPCFDLAQFLTSALENFRFQSSQLKAAQSIPGILLLSEISGTHAFVDLVNNQQQLSDWTISATDEASSVQVTHTSGDRLFIVAGRQAVTQEKIEVLALITDAMIEDGLSLTETIEQVIAADALPVLPWAVGKWIGQRGKLVQAQLTKNHPKNDSRVFAGDNGGRPRFWPLPDYCQQQPLLPGSDPLPLPHEITRVGSFGFVTQGSFNSSKPGQSLKHILLSAHPLIQAYGQLQSPWQFIQNQTLLRLK